MNGDEPKTTFELDAERRAIGRKNTAYLLKMLRGGYGTEPESESVAEVRPVAELRAARVAEAAPAYVRLVETRPDQPLTRPASSAFAIPSVGEGLRQSSGNLGALVARADQWSKLDRLFQAYLRPDLRGHTVLIRLDQDAWTVQTESSVWAVRLRYELYAIREALGLELGIKLPKPQVHISPLAAPPPAPTSRRRILPQEAARGLEEIARHETNPRLSAALRRLARWAEPVSTIDPLCSIPTKVTILKP